MAHMFTRISAPKPKSPLLLREGMEAMAAEEKGFITIEIIKCHHYWRKRHPAMFYGPMRRHCGKCCSKEAEIIWEITRRAAYFMDMIRGGQQGRLN